MNSQKRKTLSLHLGILFLLSSCFSGFLALKTINIRFWPTDSYYFYIPTAAKIWNLRNISDIHQFLPPGSLGQIVMHGKEAFIAGIALMQSLLNDPTGLFPNVLLLILAVQISTLTLYFTLQKLLSPAAAFLVSLLFMTSCWPYMYALQGVHQPFVLMMFLLSLLCWVYGRTFLFMNILAGLFLGLTLFSSPTAFLYLPYFVLADLLNPKTKQTKLNFFKIILKNLCFLLGAGAVIIFFTLPDPMTYSQGFFKFLLTSQKYNHFDYYHQALSKILPAPYPAMAQRPVLFHGGGLKWAVKYALLIQPLTFSVYCAIAVYFFIASFKKKKYFLILLLSLSTPILIQLLHIAQFGRNYFSWYLGVIMIIGAILHRALPSVPQAMKKFIIFLGIVFFSIHIFYNGALFFYDILPTRMATARVFDWLKQNGAQEVYIYQHHPGNHFTADILNQTKDPFKIKFYTIESAKQVKSGYLLLPPISSDSIWHNCIPGQLVEDTDLLSLFENRHIDQATAASFKGLPTSKIWLQEEEVCAYRDLYAGQITRNERTDQIIRIIDLRKLNELLLNTTD